jgi:hypothetical protein
MEITIISFADWATCPRCHHISPKCYDRRVRRKRDVPLLGRQVSLLLVKRRFWCLRCQRAFTEPDTICGWRRRTTVRLRDYLGTCARSRPITHVATELQVGPLLVQTCLEAVAQAELTTHGRTLDPQAPMPNPPLLGHR